MGEREEIKTLRFSGGTGKKTEVRLGEPGIGPLLPPLLWAGGSVSSVIDCPRSDLWLETWALHHSGAEEEQDQRPLVLQASPPSQITPSLAFRLLQK